MYARIINITAQSETQLTMWKEMFKNIGSKNLSELGSNSNNFDKNFSK